MITVIVPCYNQAKFLEEALKSVSEQSYSNWECIIVDDGSTDNTEEVALKWSKSDQRYKFIKKENGGLGSARNAGMKIASGKYIQFLDADDVIDKRKFSLQIDQIKGASDYIISYTDYFTSTEFDLSEPFPSRYLSPRFTSQNYLVELITKWEAKLSIPCHCFLFASKIFKDNNISFDERLPNHEDWECWMNVFATSPEVFYIDKKLATYRIRSNAMCYDRNLMKEGFLMAIKKQKWLHRKDKTLGKLFVVRHNQLKYGKGTNYKIIALGSYYFRKLKRMLKQILSGKELNFRS